ncbi:MAG: response regulator [Limnothrix sp.]
MANSNGIDDTLSDLVKGVNQSSVEEKEKSSAVNCDSYSVLLVEDQVGYLELMCEAIAGLLQNITVETANNGEQAWSLLNLDASMTEKPIAYPSLIITDLNLPRLSGLELLSRIKKDQKLQAIPIVVFSTSQAESDILSCYQAHANCFITKPRDLDAFIEVVQSIVTFWLNLVCLPEPFSS